MDSYLHRARHGRPAPLAIELTLAETQCQEDTAREPLKWEAQDTRTARSAAV